MLLTAVDEVEIAVWDDEDASLDSVGADEKLLATLDSADLTDDGGEDKPFSGVFEGVGAGPLDPHDSRVKTLSIADKSRNPCK